MALKKSKKNKSKILTAAAITAGVASAAFVTKKLFTGKGKKKK